MSLMSYGFLLLLKEEGRLIWSFVIWSTVMAPAAALLEGGLRTLVAYRAVAAQACPGAGRSAGRTAIVMRRRTNRAAVTQSHLRLRRSCTAEQCTMLVLKCVTVTVGDAHA